VIKNYPKGELYMDFEASEEDIKKAHGLFVLLLVGAIIQILLMVGILYIFAQGGVLDDSGSGGTNFGGVYIFILVGFLNIPLIAAAVFVYMRSGYTIAGVLLVISIITTLPVGTIFVIIGLFKMRGARNAFPSQLESSIKRAEAKKKLAKEKSKEKIELECPQCEKDFKVLDTGKRPLPIKCPHCGVEGEI